jgi:hypothetical protein
LSRPSVSESLKIYKMFLPYPYQHILSDVEQDKRYLAVIFANSDTSSFNEHERLLVSKCELYKKSQKFSVYKLSVQNLKLNSNAKNIKRFDSISNRLCQKNNILYTDTSQFTIFMNFDTLKSKISYNGAGSFIGKKSEFNFIYKTPTNVFDTTKQYIVSFWYYNKIWDQTFNTAIISEDDSLGKNLQYQYYSPIETNLIDGWWYYSEYKFKPKTKSKKSSISFLFKGYDFFMNWFAIDDFLIRPVGTDVYWQRTENGKHIVYKNNKKFCLYNR